MKQTENTAMMVGLLTKMIAKTSPKMPLKLRPDLNSSV
jgi:hypothetical protein